jgi:hypothetical protein
MVGLLESFNHIPSLSFHNGHLSGKHAFLEIGIFNKDSSQGSLSAAPPSGGCK